MDESWQTVWQGDHVEPDWFNSAYNPTQNAAGYTRFDSSVYGGGLERLERYKQAPPLWYQYSKTKPGQPGYDHFQGATGILKKWHGVDDWTKATDKQLFDAMDSEFRGAQADNQKEHGLGIFGKALGLLAPAAGFLTGNPWVGGLLGAGIGGATGGVKGAALGGLTGAASGYFSSGYGPFSPATSAIGAAGDAGAWTGLANQGFPGDAWAAGGGGWGPSASSAAWGGLSANGVPSPWTPGIQSEGAWTNPGLPASDPTLSGWSPDVSVGGTDDQLWNSLQATDDQLWNSAGPGTLNKSTNSNNDLLKRVGVNAVKGLLSTPPAGASVSGRMAASGGGNRELYIPLLPPPPQGLPDYFEFRDNPFGVY